VARSVSRLPDPDRSRAVLIGASRYADPELLALPGVTGNLADLAGVLTSPRGTGLAGCTVLADEPDPATVGEALVRAAEQASDMLLVYYAGHGLTWTNRNELYLALRGTRPHAVGTSALRCADVRQVFLDSPATTRVLILDCCFSGRAIEQGMSGSGAADALLGEVDVEGAYILAATEGPRMALAPAGQRHTLFTGELLRLLTEGVPGGPALLTLDVLYRELRARLRRRNLPVPSCSASASAAHLALAPNADPARPADPAAALAAALAGLVAAEEAATRAYGYASTRIADLGRPAPGSTAAALRDRLAAAGEACGSGEAALRGEIETAHAAAVAARRAYEQALERREELRGRLAVHLAVAVRRGVGERDRLTTLYRRARDLLYTRPCDLRAATRAVWAYGQAVHGDDPVASPAEELADGTGERG
jgi:Caspase domain